MQLESTYIIALKPELWRLIKFLGHISKIDRFYDKNVKSATLLIVTSVFIQTDPTYLFVTRPSYL